MRPLPDTSKWLPQKSRRVALRQTRLQTCRGVEARIKAEARIETSFNINNFDSGPGVEDLVRDQFRSLLPERYAVSSGVIMDSHGDTCNECDLVVLNRFWAPLLKYGSTNESRRIHIPVEAVYSVIEIKQTLTERSLDDAMKKLVTYKHLERLRSEYGRLVENHVIRELDVPDASLNRRFDAVLAVGCEEGKDEELIKRFFRINKSLPPELQVNALAVLGSGYACYIVEAHDGSEMHHLYPESDMSHFYGWKPKAVKPFRFVTARDSLFHLYSNLIQHLTLTVLNFREQKLQYGWQEADKEGYDVTLD